MLDSAPEDTSPMLMQPTTNSTRWREKLLNTEQTSSRLTSYSIASTHDFDPRFSTFEAPLHSTKFFEEPAVPPLPQQYMQEGLGDPPVATDAVPQISPAKAFAESVRQPHKEISLVEDQSIDINVTESPRDNLITCPDTEHTRKIDSPSQDTSMEPQPEAHPSVAPCHGSALVNRVPSGISSGSARETDDTDELVNSLETEDEESKIRINLGPKMKIFSPAPWEDADESDSASIHSASTGLSFRGRRSTDSTSKRSVNTPSIKEGKTKSSRSRSFSILSVKKLEPHEAFRNNSLALGVGLGTSLPVDEPKLRSPRVDKVPPMPPLPSEVMQSRKDSVVSTNSSDMSHRVHTSPAAHLQFNPHKPQKSLVRSDKTLQQPIPPGFDIVDSNYSMSATVEKSSFLPIYTAPTTLGLVSPSASVHSHLEAKSNELNVQLRPSASAPNLLHKAGVLQESPVLVSGGQPLEYGTGQKLISLAEARQREMERVAQMIPEEPEPQSQSRSRSASKSKLRTKKSGFLKKFINNDKPAPDNLALNVSSLAISHVEDRYQHPLSSPSTPVPNKDTSSLWSSSGRSDRSRSNTSDGSRGAGNSARTMKSSSPNLAENGTLPALSLRPVSAALSSTLPADFLHASDYAPVLPYSRAPSVTSIAIPHVTSPVERSFPTRTSLASPHASSFTSTSKSSLFEDDELGTPLTPEFRSLDPSSSIREQSPALPSASSLSESYAALMDRFKRSKRTWQTREFDLESQITRLRAELDAAYGVVRNCSCTDCGCSKVVGQQQKSKSPEPNSLYSLYSHGRRSGGERI